MSGAAEVALVPLKADPSEPFRCEPCDKAFETSKALVVHQSRWCPAGGQLRPAAVKAKLPVVIVEVPIVGFAQSFTHVVEWDINNPEIADPHTFAAVLCDDFGLYPDQSDAIANDIQGPSLA